MSLGKSLARRRRRQQTIDVIVDALVAVAARDQIAMSPASIRTHVKNVIQHGTKAEIAALAELLERLDR